MQTDFSKYKKKISSTVLDTLSEYNSLLGNSAKKERNLEALTKSETIAVITGQQCTLFGGALFNLYKIASTIRTAEDIQKSTKIPCVPIFWLQNEDHDFEEISSVYLPSNQGLKKISSNTFGKDNRISISDLKIGSFQKQLEAFGEEIKHLPYSEKYIDLLSECYQEKTSLSDAYAKLVNQLFKESGLLIFNPSQQKVKEELKPIFKLALDNYSEIAKLISEENVEQQIHIREDSPLFFYQSKSENSSRYRLKDTKDNWQLISCEETLSKKHIEKDIDVNPEKFSTSALLRPITQDYLFPTAIYIAGPSELKYHKQLKSVYPFFGLKQPEIVQRAKFWIQDKKQKQWLEELNISIPDLILNEKELSEKLLPSNTNLEEQITSKLSELLKILEAEISDETLKKPFQKTKTSIEYNLENFLNKLKRSKLNQNQIKTNRLEKLKEQFYPNNLAQERVYSMLYYLALYDTNFIESVFAAIRPFSEQEDSIEL